MRRIPAAIPVTLSMILTGCGGNSMNKNGYRQIDQEEAWQMIRENEDVLVLDVRERYEYRTGHIPGAMLLPLDTIDRESAEAAIGEKDKKVLVYCRSGSRSRMAAKALTELGYTNIYEIGGIINWPYDIER